MKKVALLLSLLGACFFAGCAKEESATVETQTESPAGEVETETEVTTTTE